jgi:hypothetical protein
MLEILIVLSLLLGATICVDTAMTVFTRNERNQKRRKINETTTSRPRKFRSRNY